MTAALRGGGRNVIDDTCVCKESISGLFGGQSVAVDSLQEWKWKLAFFEPLMERLSR
jgi:hypothetical protein